MDASTQTENISAISGILNVMLLIFIEAKEEKRSDGRELNIPYSKEMHERYEEEIYDSYFYEDRIDILADKYRNNYDSQVKYTTHIYMDDMDDFHRGKSSNAKKKSKRSVSCAHIPDACDKQEEQNAYYDVMFSGDRVLYY